MRPGDQVRDIANLRGVVLEIKPGLVCMVRVKWAADFTTWIKAKWLRVTGAA